MDQSTTESLRAHIRQCLERLTTIEWSLLESGSLDKTTEDVIMNICVDVVNTIFLHMYGVFSQRKQKGTDTPKSSKSSPGSAGSQESSVSEDDVCGFLRDTISLAFAEAIGVPEICSQSVKKLTDAMIKEVTERMNRFFKSSESIESNEESQPLMLYIHSFLNRLKTMVRHVVKILINCASKKGQQSLTMEAAEHNVTLESQMSFKDKITKAVRSILRERAEDISPINYYVHISEEEVDIFETGSSQDTDEMASAIVRQIMEELHLDSDGSHPESMDESENRSHWKTLGITLKAFFAKRFAMESLLGLMAKLHSKYECLPKEPSSLSQLMEEADEIVRSIILLNEEDVRKATEDEILDEVIDSMASKLSNIVCVHLQPEAPTVGFRFEVQSEVDTLMWQVRNWLNRQLKLHKHKRGHASLAVKQIRKVVCQESLTEIPSVVGSGSVTPVVVEAKPPSTPVQSIKSPMEAKAGDTCVVGGKPPSALVQCTESSDRVEAAVETAAPAAHQWDDTSCRFMAIALTQRFMKSPIHSGIHITSNDIEAISKSLAESFLEQIKGSEVTVKPSGHNFKKVAKALHKELCKVTGNANNLKMCLLSRDASIYRCITETLTQHLVTPEKKTGVNRFFSRLFKTVAKPFAACFGRKE